MFFEVILLKDALRNVTAISMFVCFNRTSFAKGFRFVCKHKI